MQENKYLLRNLHHRCSSNGRIRWEWLSGGHISVPPPCRSFSCCTLNGQLTAAAWRSIERVSFFFVLSEETKPKKAWLATTSPMKKPCRGWKTSLTSSGSTPSRQHAPLTLGKSIQSYVKWNDWISYSYRWSKSATCCNVDSRFYLRGPVHVLQIIPARWKM